MQILRPVTPIIGLRLRNRLASPIRTTFAFVREEKVKLSLVLSFFVAHVLLAMLMTGYSKIANLHVLVTIAGSLWLAVSRKIERAAYAGAYITGAEVFWRMTGAFSVWEIGKYGVAAVFIVAMIRHRRLKPSILPVLYFLLLLPSAFLTIEGLSFTESRQLLSSDLSGPLSLMIAGCFFSQLTMTREELLRLFLILIGPVITVASFVFFRVAMRDEINFGSSSNFATSGGFGPNQVSSVLSVGALACFLVLLSERAELKLKLLAGGLMIYLTAQSALTFSRGGVYNIVGAILLASIFLLKDTRTRVKFGLAVLLIGSVSYFVVLPRLDAFTGGALSARFEDTRSTGRDEIVQMDLDIWYDNPFLGVGPGRASEYRAEIGFDVSAHTEFTRLLAEHGVFGLAAVFLFAGIALRNVLRVRTAMEKGVVVALVAWSFLFMLNAGMRIVAPSFVFGLAFASIKGGRMVADRLRERRSLPLPLAGRLSKQSR